MKTKIQSLERVIMRYMALGATEEWIAEMQEIPLPTIKKITKSPLFKSELQEMQHEIDQQVVKEAAGDPVIQKAKVFAMQAMASLCDEIKGEGDSTPMSRIKASEKVLSYAGYGKETEGPANIVINISSSKAENIKTDTVPVEMPENVEYE